MTPYTSTYTLQSTQSQPLSLSWNSDILRAVLHSTTMMGPSLSFSLLVNQYTLASPATRLTRHGRNYWTVDTSRYLKARRRPCGKMTMRYIETRRKEGFLAGNKSIMPCLILEVLIFAADSMYSIVYIVW